MKGDDKVENRVRQFTVFAMDDTDTHITIDVCVNANQSRTKGEARQMEDSIKDKLMRMIADGDVKTFHTPLHKIKVSKKR